MSRIILNDNFSLRSCGRNYYLCNLDKPVFIYEPYKVTKAQYFFMLKLNGNYTTEELFAEYPKTLHKSLQTFIKDLKSIGAISYTQTKLRKFSYHSKEPHLGEVQFELTKRCNLNCKHCYQEKYLQSSQKDLTIQEINELAEQLEQLNAIKISISGGEPLLRKDLGRILGTFRSHGIKVDCIFTNASLIENTFIQMLQKLNCGTSIFVSLDGPNANIHGKIRGLPTKDRKVIFDKVINGIKELKENEILTKVNTVTHKYNVDELPRMYSMIKRLGIGMWRLAIPKFVGRYQNNYYQYDPDKRKVAKNYKKLIELFLEDIKTENDKIIVPFDLRIANAFKTEMLVKPIFSYTFNESTCEYQRNRVTIKPNGDITPCGLLTDYVMGNIRKESIKDVWYSKKLQYFKKFEIKKVKECSECKYVEICGTGCRANSLFTYNDLFHKDDEACLCFSFWEDVINLVQKYGFNINILDRKQYGGTIKNPKIVIKNSNYYIE